MSAGVGCTSGLGVPHASVGCGLDDVIGASLAHMGIGDGMRLLTSVAAAGTEDLLDEGGLPWLRRAALKVCFFHPREPDCDAAGPDAALTPNRLHTLNFGGCG